METATIRIPEDKKNLLKAVASLENRKMNDILVDLIDEYVGSRKETLELLAIPGFFRRLQAARREFREGKGVPIEDVRKELENRFLKNGSKIPRKNGNVRSQKNPRSSGSALAPR
jgi:PHD/YefM family antitoxin component YafN of YafNO toxin-antitoxin module